MAAIILNLVDRKFLRKKRRIQNLAILCGVISAFIVNTDYINAEHIEGILAIILIISFAVLVISWLIPADTRFVGQAILTEDKLETVIGGSHTTYHLHDAGLVLATCFRPDIADSKLQYTVQDWAWNNFLLLPGSDSNNPIKIELEPDENIFAAKKMLKIKGFATTSLLTEKPGALLTFLTP